MGAHSIGKMRVYNSGYRGKFDTTNYALDNKYYQDMVDTSISWSNEEIKRSSKWQFSGSDSNGNVIGTRLNTDLELVYDLTLADDDSCTCEVGTDCDLTENYDLVQSYANVSHNVNINKLIIDCIFCLRMLTFGPWILLPSWKNYCQLDMIILMKSNHFNVYLI